MPKKNNSTLFKKAACFTDIHFGLKNNSHLHNEDCLEFIKWFIKTAKEKECETCIFLGDWHHQRASINVSTMNYTLKALSLLNENFEIACNEGSILPTLLQREGKKIVTLDEFLRGYKFSIGHKLDA